MNIAIILAGGAGLRMKTEIPKQFIEICGKTIIEHTLDVFEQHPHIDEIAIVINAQYIKETEKILQVGAYKKVKKILSGGAERHNSAWVAINAYKKLPNANLIIHDAVRPMIDTEIITEVIAELKKYNAVAVAVPTTDTIYQVEDSIIRQIPNRRFLMRAQTPQAFKQHILQTAYQKAFEHKEFTATDDCGVVTRFLPHEPIFVLPGNERNLKITYKEDIYIFALQKNKP
jgi:2-C-methyl-D-erythritol 4-phosphate cytidylyltransferase